MWIYIPGKVDTRAFRVTRLTVTERGGGIEIEYQERGRNPCKFMTRDKVTVKVGTERADDEDLS